jgi:4-amino-4-deoxy-L-arabinose transferase-like glycosyltransferase
VIAARRLIGGAYRQRDQRSGPAADCRSMTLEPQATINAGRPSGLRGPLAQQAVLVLVAALVFFTGLGRMRLMDRDEPRNAGCAAEMLARGDWVVPVFNAELRTHKPVLTYWFMMSAYAAFGVGEFGARFWSAVLGIATVLMTYHIGRRLFNTTAAFWGAIATATALWFAIAARIATPDSVLVFFATVPVLLFVLAAFAPKADPDGVEQTRLRDPASPFPRAWWVAAGMYAAMGLAILAKGPVGIVLPMGVIGMFLLIVSERKETGAQNGWMKVLGTFSPAHVVRAGWSMRPVAGAIIALAVSAPWYIMVHLRTHGEWTRGFFLDHNLGRATSAMEGHGGEGLLYLLYLGYYPAVTMIAFLPWSVFLIEAVVDGGRRVGRNDPWRLGYIFAACWIGVYLVAFTIVGTKLPSYITPIYPALGLVVGAFVYQLVQGRQLTRARAPVFIFVVVILLGIAIAVGVPLAAARLMPGSGWLGVVGAIPIAAGSACLWLYRRGQRRASMRVFGAASVVFTTTILAGVLYEIDHRHQKSGAMLAAIFANDADPALMSYGVLEPTWVFYARRPIREFHGDTAPVIEGMKNPAAVLITSMDDYEAMARLLPPEVEVIARIPRYLRPDRPDIVAVGRLAQSPSRSETE